MKMHSSAEEVIFLRHIPWCNSFDNGLVPSPPSCRYGFGVGGEYPMASSSATERSEASAYWRKRRGEQVVLTFSNQVREAAT